MTDSKQQIVSVMIRALIVAAVVAIACVNAAEGDAEPLGTVIGIDAHFKINRQDYGVSFNKVIDNGGLMVSDDVNVEVSFEAGKK